MTLSPHSINDVMISTHKHAVLGVFIIIMVLHRLSYLVLGKMSPRDVGSIAQKENHPKPPSKAAVVNSSFKQSTF